MDLPLYLPGLHKLVTLHVDEISKLTNSKDFVAVTNSILEKYGLEKIGLVVHDFDDESFTALVSIQKSHICIHTSTAYNRLTLDVYLSNYLEDNSEKVRNITADYMAYFDAEIIKDFEINR